MARPTRLAALAVLLATAVSVGACASAPPIPFRFTFSPVNVERVEGAAGSGALRY